MSGSGDDEDVATSDALLRAAAQRLSKREQSIQAQAEEIRALSDKLIERSKRRLTSMPCTHRPL